MHLLEFQRVDAHVCQVTNSLLKINQAIIPQSVLNELKWNKHSVLKAF